jgi:hypothetical protein
MATSDAEARGWGKGWPTTRVKDMAWITVRGVTVPNGVHRDLAPLVSYLMEETLGHGYPLKPGWCWGYCCRPISGSARASNHSWGLAVDLNAPTNPMRRPLTTNMPVWMVKLWEDHGFRWGGRYTGTPDSMHYEFMGSPADARAASARVTGAGKIEEAKVVRASGERKYAARIGKGVVIVNEKGETFAFQTPDRGGYNRLPAAARQGEREFVGIFHDTTNAPDGYTLVADDGALYTF